MDLLIDRIDSKIGEILVVCDGKSLCALDYAGCEPRMTASLAVRYGRGRVSGATRRFSRRARP